MRERAVLGLITGLRGAGDDAALGAGALDVTATPILIPGHDQGAAQLLAKLRTMEKLIRHSGGNQAMSPRMFGLCLRLLGRKDLAEEVLQDAFVRIWHHAGEYHAERGTPAGWMLTVARYRALDVLRRRRFELTLDRGRPFFGLGRIQYELLTAGEEAFTGWTGMLLKLNPFTHLAITYQEILYFKGPVGHWYWLLVLGAISIAFFFFGYFVFDRLRDTFAEEV